MQCFRRTKLLYSWIKFGNSIAEAQPRNQSFEFGLAGNRVRQGLSIMLYNSDTAMILTDIMLVLCWITFINIRNTCIHVSFFVSFTADSIK